MNEEMMKAMAGKQMPEMAIVESNTLAAMGLRQLLESVMPMMKISTFGSFRQYEANNPDHFVHSFVSMHIVLEHRYFFTQGNRNRHVIVLTPSNDPNSQLARISLSLRQCTRRIPDKRASQPAAFRSSSWRTYPCHAPCHSGKSSVG